MSPVEHHVGTPNAAADDDFNMAASTSSEEKWKDVPDKYLLVIAHFLAGQTNDTADMERFNGPILKASIKSVYWLFLIQYAALALLGVILNIAIIVYIMYHRLYKDITHAFIINLALCHFVQCALVLPISLMVMILQNWIFGQFLCFFLPMLQDIPLHVAMISHILIAWDRMRWLNDPLKGRIPGFVCCCATWLTGMVIALPYPIYTIYVELADYMPQLAGIGLCVVNLMDDMQEYSRGLFLIMYCGPAILLSYLYIRTSQELRPPDGPFAVMMYEHRADVRMRQRNSSTTSAEPRAHAGGGVAGLANGHGASNRSYDLYNAELDVNREKLKQRNFGSMAATQVVCLCPLMILRFARLSLEETYENQKHFDFTYLMFVWIAFLPTVIFPCIYASQILPRNEQERLRGYFRLSSKRKAKSKRRSEDFREDSVEKDEQTNTTNIVGQTVVHSSIDQPKPQAKGTVSTLRPERSQGHGLSSTDRYGGAHFRQGQSGGKERGDRERDRDKDREKDRERDRDRDRERERIERQRNSLGGRGPGDAGAVNNLGKNMRGKKHDVKINIISDGAHGTSGTSGTGRKQQQQQPPSSSSNNSSSRIKTPGNTHVHPTNSLARQTHGHNRHKVAIECMSVSNNSVSHLNGSTFCNANSSSLLDDSGTSNYGDGEESSVVSSMMHPPQRWPQSAGIRHKDVSFSECSSSTFSSSTLDRDLEIIDLLERERSMDIQEMMHREQQGEKVRLSVSEGVGRQLPDIEKIYAQRSPKNKRDSGYGYDKTSLALVMPGSDPLSMSLSSSSQPTEYSLCSTLQDHHLQNQQQPQLQHQQHHLQLQTHKQQQQQQQQQQQRLDEDEVPQDFYDSYTPGGSNNLPPAMKVAMMQGTTAAQPTTPPTYQYQYSRRASRKTSSAGLHHVTGGGVSTRGAKRDSFNSLNGTDLIAGAFCELDPTQPLNKMTGLDGRMRRSSPRNNSFSSNSARSSIKSRDYGHSSTHSAHPELDFRENIFAEL